MSDLSPGTVFAGHRIEAVVGRGGMGVVYRAAQLDLERTVALKLVAPELLEDETARRRFLQESKLAASIDHPHVIPIHYAGEEAGIPYLAMRYVTGDDTRSLVRREGPLAPARSARIVAQVADALDAAHAAGLVHRDVKPANVLLASGDHAYLSDFGLTRHVRSISGATRSGQWVGTLDYVAPEQIRGGHVDARADVYALGCVLFFLLTGQVPFPREGDEARLWAHLTEPPPRISELAPDVPAAFDEVIRRALAKAPDDRYPSTGDLGRAALAAAVGVPVAEPERLVASGDAAPAESATRTSAGLREAAPARPPRSGRLAITTPAYNTAVVPVSQRAFPYGGIELARLFDGRQEVAAGIGGRPPAAFGLLVRDASGRRVLATQVPRRTLGHTVSPLRLTRARAGVAASTSARRAYAGPFRDLRASGVVRSRTLAARTSHRFTPRFVETAWSLRRHAGRARYFVDVLFPSWGRRALIVAVRHDGSRVAIGRRRVPLADVAYLHVQSAHAGYVVVPRSRMSGATAHALRPRRQSSAPRPGPTLALQIVRARRLGRAALAVRLAPASGAAGAAAVAARLRAR